jgi:hypothetical protein
MLRPTPSYQNLALAAVRHLSTYGTTAEANMTMMLAPPHSRAAHGATPILLIMSLCVLIAPIDGSVVNLAVKEIGAYHRLFPRKRESRWVPAFAGTSGESAIVST